jgi:S1-C subfamily serine protease
MKKILVLAATIFFSIIVPAFCGDMGNLEKAMVKIFTVANNPDYYQPWQMVGQGSSSGSGCVIDGNRILTNAHVVSNATFIQVNKSGETQKYVAKVLAVDHECDLAILTVNDKDFFRDVPPVSIGDVPSPGDMVKVLGFPIGGEKLSVTEGVVSRIEIGQYSHSLRSFLTVQLDAAINPGNSGGPVFKGNRLVGVAFQGMDKAQSIGYAIPTVMIKHFLKDLQGKKYGGFPTLGVNTQSLENESYRKKLGMSKKQTGVVVEAVEFGSVSYGVIQPGDVILAVDGVKIENDGTVPYGGRGRLDMSYITDLKYAGDKVKIEILRNKKPVKISIVMRNYVPILPRTEYDVKPTYYIFGGLVFTRLSINYIYSIWDSQKGRPGILERILYENATPDKQEIVLLLQVLADESNKGYHEFGNTPVTKVNGEKISGMKDLINKIENSKAEFLEIDLDNMSKIVLETEKSRKASPAILQRYGIASDRSENLVTTKAAEQQPNK